MPDRTTKSIALVGVTAAMGGVEFSTLYLARELDRERFRPLVVCPGDGLLLEECRKSDIAVLIVPRPRTFSTSLRVGRRSLLNPVACAFNLFSLLLASVVLAAALRKHKVDLVCTKGLLAHFYGGLAARFLRLPCVWHMQDLLSEQGGGVRVRVAGVAARRLATAVIADGAPIARQLSAFVHPSNLTVIHNGVDTELFSPTRDGTGVRSEWGVGPDELLIGNVARLTAWKGQDYLIRAFAIVLRDYPATRLVLVGASLFDSTAFERELRGLAVELGIAARVLFAGQRQDLPEVLAALDVYVHCSVEKDTSPLAVVSAMAAGKPIVATVIAGVTELFGTEQAILVAPADAAALADGLKVMLHSAERRAVLGQAARREAEQRLGVGLFTRRCEAVFNSALAGRRIGGEAVLPAERRGY